MSIEFHVHGKVRNFVIKEKKNARVWFKIYLRHEGSAGGGDTGILIGGVHKTPHSS